MAISTQDRNRALKGLSDLGFTNPDDLELQGFLDENPAQAEPTPQVNLNDGVARTPQEIRAARQAAGLDPVTGQAIPESTPEPTTGDLGLVMPEDISQPTDLDRDYDAYLKSITQPVSDEEIRQRKLAEIQAEIDATNKIFADKLQREMVRGRGRLGSDTAMSGRRGLLGSDFGEARARSVEDLNKESEDLIEQERLAIVSALMRGANTAAAEEAAAKRAALLGGFEARKARESEKEERKIANASKAAKNLILQGFSPDKLSSQELGLFTKRYGITKDELTSAYDSALSAQAAAEFEREGELLSRGKTQAEIDKINSDTKLAKEKFEEDKRQFGLTYAIQQADLAIKQAKAVAEGVTTGGIPIPEQKLHLDFLKKTATDAQDLASASGKGVWDKTAGYFVGSSKWNQLDTLTQTLKTNLLTLNTNPDVKKFFGPQMSEADVRMMTASGTTLDAATLTPTQMGDELTRVFNLFGRIQKALPEGVTAAGIEGTGGSESESETYQVGNDTYVLGDDGRYYLQK